MTTVNSTIVGTGTRARPILRDLRAFLSATLRRPGATGAMAPTGSRAASTVASIVPTHEQSVVVELGAGAGAISDAISARLGDSGRHLAVEVDPGLAGHLRRTRPTLEVIEGDAAELRTHLRESAAGSADAIVSSLPWTLLDGDQQCQLLTEVAGALAPGGAFTAIGYMTAVPTRARAFHQRLTDRFDEVVLSKTVWGNIPPARVYYCRRPTWAPEY